MNVIGLIFVTRIGFSHERQQRFPAVLSPVPRPRDEHSLVARAQLMVAWIAVGVRPGGGHAPVARARGLDCCGVCLGGARSEDGGSDSIRVCGSLGNLIF